MKIALLAGSNRKGASSTSLVKLIAKRMEQNQIQATVFDLAEWQLPIYSPDEDYTNHDGVRRLRRLMLEADGIVLSTPEYHASISGALKNALDYLGQDHFRGKPVLSISSAGGPVGVSSLTQLQAIVRNLHGINSPHWISIGGDQRARYESPAIAELDNRAVKAMEALLELTGQLRRV